MFKLITLHKVRDVLFFDHIFQLVQFSKNRNACDFCGAATSTIQDGHRCERGFFLLQFFYKSLRLSICSDDKQGIGWLSHPEHRTLNAIKNNMPQENSDAGEDAAHQKQKTTEECCLEEIKRQRKTCHADDAGIGDVREVPRRCLSSRQSEVPHRDHHDQPTEGRDEHSEEKCSKREIRRENPADFDEVCKAVRACEYQSVSDEPEEGKGEASHEVGVVYTP